MREKKITIRGVEVAFATIAVVVVVLIAFAALAWWIGFNSTT